MIIISDIYLGWLLPDTDMQLGQFIMWQHFIFGRSSVAKHTTPNNGMHPTAGTTALM